MESKRTCVVSRRALRRRSFIYFLFFFFAVTCACLVTAPKLFHFLNARWLTCRCDASLSGSSFTLHTSTQRYWQSVREAEENVNKSLLLFSSLLFLILVILAHWRQLVNQKYMNRKKKKTLDTKQQKCNQVKWAYFELSCTSLFVSRREKKKKKKEEVNLDCGSWQWSPFYTVWDDNNAVVLMVATERERPRKKKKKELHVLHKQGRRPPRRCQIEVKHNQERFIIFPSFFF